MDLDLDDGSGAGSLWDKRRICFFFGLDGGEIRWMRGFGKVWVLGWYDGWISKWSLQRARDAGSSSWKRPPVSDPYNDESE